MVFRGLFVALGCCALFLAGCSIVDQQLRERYLRRAGLAVPEVSIGFRGSKDQPVRQITHDDLRRDVVGSHASGWTIVHYPEGLAELAAAVAGRLDSSLRLVERELGITIPLGFEVYLIQRPEGPGNFDITLPQTDGRLIVPMFVSGSEANADAVLTSWLYALVHEAVEVTMVSPQYPPVVAPDIAGHVLGIPYLSCNYTRWVRDGLANYAGCIALSGIAPDASGERSHVTTLERHDQPMARLATAGTDLLRWKQDSVDHYDAALGLFLLIEHRYGRAAIRTFIHRIDELEWADGPSLERLLSEVIGEDVRSVIQSMPRLNHGLSIYGPPVRIMDVASGTAFAAGIRPKDVVTAINGHATPTVADFDRQMFLAAEHGEPVAVTVHRNDVLMQFTLPSQ